MIEPISLLPGASRRALVIIREYLEGLPSR